jgi:hypothetical protein
MTPSCPNSTRPGDALAMWNGEDDVVPKLLMMDTKRWRNKEELMKHMSQCGQLSGNLFFWEPRIATSSCHRPAMSFQPKLRRRVLCLLV